MTEQGSIRQCGTCLRFHQISNPRVMCAVMHLEGQCCHYGDTEVSPPEPPPAPVKVVPEIDEEALLGAVLAVISGHAVVKPGETLIIRVKDWNPEQVEYYQEHLDRLDLPFGALVVIGDELAVAEHEPRIRLA